MSRECAATSATPSAVVSKIFVRTNGKRNFKFFRPNEQNTTLHTKYYIRNLHTDKPLRSACNCISKLFAATGPSTLSFRSFVPILDSMAIKTSFV